MPIDLHFTVVKEAFGGRHGGIVFVEYRMVSRTAAVTVCWHACEPALQCSRSFYCMSNTMSENLAAERNSYSLAILQGERTGFVRVKDREQMAALMERLDENGTIELDTCRAGVEVLDGDEERDFHARVSI